MLAVSGLWQLALISPPVTLKYAVVWLQAYTLQCICQNHLRGDYTKMLHQEPGCLKTGPENKESGTQEELELRQILPLAARGEEGPKTEPSWVERTKNHVSINRHGPDVRCGLGATCRETRTGGMWSVEERLLHMNYLELKLAFLAKQVFATQKRKWPYPVLTHCMLSSSVASLWPTLKCSIAYLTTSKT